MEGQISVSSVIDGRLAALRFPPYFFGAVAASSLGDLTALWMRLSQEDRDAFQAFERAYRQGHRHELRGENAEAGEIYRSLLGQFPLFRTLALERLQALGLPAEVTTKGNTDA